jgi:hypothetical protein
MTNKKHIDLLAQGIHTWNSWREKNQDIIPNLQEANLRKADLRHANLCGANLLGADLFGAKLSGADLSGADLSGANLFLVDFLTADLCGTNLSGANLCEASFFAALLSGADFSGAILHRAKLREANLSEVNLSGADLNRADLGKATLLNIQALGTNFEKTILTGAHVEDWSINSETKLDRVICEYVYVKRHYQERRPNLGKFSPGEFAKLFTKVGSLHQSQELYKLAHVNTTASSRLGSAHPIFRGSASV